MKLTFHGGFYEIGRSCIEIQTKQTKLLLDAGTKFSSEGTEYPLIRHVADVDAIALSHAHLDHCGALPWYRYKGFQGHIFCTRATKALVKILLRDSYRIEQLHQRHSLYTEEDIFAALDSMTLMEFRESKKMNDINLTLFDSGHIPGASSIRVDAEGQHVLYTGDINTEDTNLMHGADIDYGPIDMMICEATYGHKDHPNRMQEEARFLKDVKETLSEGGSVLVAVLAIARAQEMMMMLGKEKLHAPIYLDGMAKKVLTRLLDMPKVLRNPQALLQVAERVRFVRGQKTRKEISHSQGIFIAPSGMLEGGPIIDYLASSWADEKTLIALTCYQGERTNGRMLLEKNKMILDGVERNAQCMAKKYDFSSHIGMTPLHNYIKKIKPRMLILNHGEPAALEALGQWAKEEGINVHIPKNGDTLVL